MNVKNPHALYINCDGAMDYDKGNSGGIGFIITFPDNVPLEEISISKGKYSGGNIERIEFEALIQAMNHVIELFDTYPSELKNIRQIIFITDRFALSDKERTNPFKIKQWRHDKWKNHEGKPIKNHEFLDKLDKVRTKLSAKTYARVNIEYRPRKQNKIADKLAKAGKKEGLIDTSLSKKGEKIGRRLFDGGEIKYIKLKSRQELEINVFRKDPVQEKWEVWCELCGGDNMGEKLKIYVDDKLAAKLKRGNKYIVKIKTVYRYHIDIYRSLKKPNSLKV
jgi:ribonuclease HI